jgi:hypothetical protein
VVGGWVCGGALWRRIYYMGISSERPCMRAIVVFFSLRSIVRLIGSIMLANWSLHVYGSEFIDVINVKKFVIWWCVCVWSKALCLNRCFSGWILDGRL